MKARRIAWFAAIVAVLISGCGTVCNLASGDPEVPLGGVQKDFEYIGTQRATSLSASSGKAILLIPAELCLSFVGDTLTLPLAVFIKRRGYTRDAVGDGLSAQPESQIVGSSATAKISFEGDSERYDEPDLETIEKQRGSVLATVESRFGSGAYAEFIPMVLEIRDPRHLNELCSFAECCSRPADLQALAEQMLADRESYR